MSDFPSSGDNFQVLSEWRILTGTAWFDWQKAALGAAIAASRAQGEDFEEARLRRDLLRLKAEGASPAFPLEAAAGGRSGSAG